MYRTCSKVYFTCWCMWFSLLLFHHHKLHSYAIAMLLFYTKINGLFLVSIWLYQHAMLKRYWFVGTRTKACNINLADKIASGSVNKMSSCITWSSFKFSFTKFASSWYPINQLISLRLGSCPHEPMFQLLPSQTSPSDSLTYW